MKFQPSNVMPIGSIFDMTEEQKLQAIQERMQRSDIGPEFLSVMTIHNYLNYLAEQGLVFAPCNVTPKGKHFAALCEEFDWKPSDEIIDEFITEYVEPENRESFSNMIYRFRDDRVALLEEIRNFKKNN